MTLSTITLDLHADDTGVVIIGTVVMFVGCLLAAKLYDIAGDWRAGRIIAVSLWALFTLGCIAFLTAWSILMARSIGGGA